MSYFDDVYCGLCKDILKNGVQVHNRTGIDTIKVPSAHFHLDLSKEFPILTTKQLFIRQAVTEMLWIYQAQSNDVRWLQERNVHIWDKWEINEDGDWIDENTGKVLKHFDPSFAHTIGTAYGFIVKKYDLMNKLLNSLKNDKEDRRRVISLWQDSELDTAVLPPLGLPFNVTQYAVLLMMVAKVTGLEPGTIDWSIKDAHIYVNQIDGIKEQLNRYETKGSLPAPKLWLNPDIQDFYAFDPKNDVKLIGYEHMGKISFPLAQ